jgi:pantetheine-phosphate adenylyltransferase
MIKTVYPGSFDPITLGHIDIIERAAKMFDEVVVLIAQAENKKYLFTPDERTKLAQACLKHLKNVRVDKWNGLTVDYMKKNKFSVLLRGLRSAVDFDQEWVIAQTNKKLNSDVETMFMSAGVERSFIASRVVKEVAMNQGDLSFLVPKLVEKELQKKFK